MPHTISTENYPNKCFKNAEPYKRKGAIKSEHNLWLWAFLTSEYWFHIWNIRRIVVGPLSTACLILSVPLWCWQANVVLSLHHAQQELLAVVRPNRLNRWFSSSIGGSWVHWGLFQLSTQLHFNGEQAIAEDPSSCVSVELNYIINKLKSFFLYIESPDFIIVSNHISIWSYADLHPKTAYMHLYCFTVSE